jgi:hypothetical protein
LSPWSGSLIISMTDPAREYDIPIAGFQGASPA